jgi:uncharacterized phiE125 gp8 family phage protein
MLTLVTPARATATGTLTVDSPVVAGIADTAPLAGALAVTGAGIPPNTYVESIDSASQVTLTKPATLTGDQTLTFTLQPVTMAEARSHLRLGDDTSHDITVAKMIAAATGKCQTNVRRTFLASTWDYTLDVFPWSGRRFDLAMYVRNGYAESGIRIPNPPLMSVTSLSYIDIGGSTLTLSYGTGYTYQVGTPGVIVPTYGTIWPFTRGLPGDLAVRYVAGYGTAADVPEDVKLAILMMVGYMFQNRGDEDVAMPRVVDELLSSAEWGAYS